MRRWFARIGEISLGHAFVRVEEYLLDYLLYPYMLFDGGSRLLRLAGISSASASAGFAAGFSFMLLLSIGVNIAYIAGYDRFKRDWFGFEAIKSVKPGWWEYAPRWTRSFAAAFTFAGLSMWANPLFAVLWARSDAHVFAMSKRDWSLLWLAIVIANIGWAGLMGVAAFVVKVILATR